MTQYQENALRIIKAKGMCWEDINIECKNCILDNINKGDPMCLAYLSGYTPEELEEQRVVLSINYLREIGVSDEEIFEALL